MRNGAGTYSLPESPFVFDTVISETSVNSDLSDIANALTASIANDGQTPITANLQMTGYKHTGVTATSGASSRTEYLASGVMQDGIGLNAGTTGGTSTAYTATLTPAITAYAAGQRFRVKFNAACGDNPTINFNSVGALKLYKEVTGSFVQFSSGGIPANFDADVLYDASLDSSNGGFVVLNAPLYAQGADIASASTINLDTATGDYVHVTGTTAITAVTLAQGQTRKVVFDGALTFTNGASLILPGGANITTAAGDSAVLVGEASSVVRCISYIKAAGTSIVSSASVPVRQTVLSGPVDSSGLAAFGGSTGSTTVTMSGTLVVTAANGFGSLGAVNLVGSGTNLAWTGLSTNGTMYLYVTVNADGTLTTGSGTLVPAYQFGGTYSTTSGQFTFNVQEMVGKVGNGSTADQAYRVYVGEVTVSGNVVTAIVWYQLMGRYTSPDTAIQSTATKQSFNHYLGVQYGVTAQGWLVNQSTEYGYTAGMMTPMLSQVGGSGFANSTVLESRLIASTMNGSSLQFSVANLSTGAAANITAGNWKQRMVVTRSW